MKHAVDGAVPKSVEAAEKALRARSPAQCSDPGSGFKVPRQHGNYEVARTLDRLMSGMSGIFT